MIALVRLSIWALGSTTNQESLTKYANIQITIEILSANAVIYVVPQVKVAILACARLRDLRSFPALDKRPPICSELDEEMFRSQFYES